MHFSVYGFVPILLAGALLGVIYYLTGSIWCSILGHTLHNGIQIIMEYYSQHNAAAKTMMESNQLPWYLPLGGFVLFLISFLLLLKNKTPLPADWASDYSAEELNNNNPETV
jgi:hypothetical protein